MAYLDLIFSSLLLRNFFKFLLQFDLVAITSILMLIWITIKNKIITSYNYIFLTFIFLLPITSILGYFALSNTISLTDKEVLTRIIFNSLNIFLSLFSLYKIYSSKFYKFKINFSYYLLIFILIIAFLQFLFPIIDNQSFMWLFNTNEPGVMKLSLRGFSNESGILCQNIILLLLIEEKFNTITNPKRFIYLCASFFTNSTLFLLLPIFYIMKRIKNIKMSIFSIIISLISVYIAITFNIFSLFEKSTLFFSGGGDSDLGGRYLSNALIIKNILDFNSINQILFGNGIGSYHSILEKYLYDSGFIPFSFIKDIPYDYGGSDFLIFFNDFGLIGMIIFAFIICLFVKFKNRIWDLKIKTNILFSSRIICLLLLIKGLGLYSPFSLFLLVIAFI